MKSGDGKKKMMNRIRVSMSIILRNGSPFRSVGKIISDKRFGLIGPILPIHLYFYGPIGVYMSQKRAYANGKSVRELEQSSSGCAAAINRNCPVCRKSDCTCEQNLSVEGGA